MIVLYIILAILAIFVLVLVGNTIRVTVKGRKLGEYKYWKTEEEQKEYATRLSKMIQCKSVSVEGSYDDTEFAKQREVVKELFPLVHEKMEKMTFSDDCWIYKLEGKDKSRNIMLMSHHDVVPAKGEWKQPPFSGKIEDGVIWGRGTVDTKTPLFAEFSALEELLEEGFVPQTNVYIGSSHNEELGGDGIPKALAYFKEKGINFELVLDEGGAVISPPLAGMTCRCAMLAVHEKGRYTLNCRAEQGNMHTGLTQNMDTPVVRMSKFIAEVQNTKNLFIRRMYPEVREMFKALCPYMPIPLRLVFSNLWCFEKLLVKLIPSINDAAGSMLGTTCAFNGIQGGKFNGESHNYCEATAFLRCVNDKDQEKDIEKIKAIADKYGIIIEEAPGNEYYHPADMSKAPFSYVKQTVENVFPAVAAAPFILPAGTDARHMTDVCDCVIRFAPIDIDDQQYASVHSENENITLKAIGNAVEFYTQVLKNYPQSK